MKSREDESRRQAKYGEDFHVESGSSHPNFYPTIERAYTPTQSGIALKVHTKHRTQATHTLGIELITQKLPVQTCEDTFPSAFPAQALCTVPPCPASIHSQDGVEPREPQPDRREDWSSHGTATTTIQRDQGRSHGGCQWRPKRPVGTWQGRW